MQQRHLTSAVLASAVFFALSTTAGSQLIVSGNDEKVLWDDVGQAVFSPPGKDTISFIDIGDRENPKILTSIALENSIFGPPTNLAISPNGEIALVANSVTQTKDGEKWRCRREWCWNLVTRSPAFREYLVRRRGQSVDRWALWRASANHQPCAC
jgi:hypothetical protein